MGDGDEVEVEEGDLVTDCESPNTNYHPNLPYFDPADTASDCEMAEVAPPPEQITDLDEDGIIVIEDDVIKPKTRPLRPRPVRPRGQ